MTTGPEPVSDRKTRRRILVGLASGLIVSAVALLIVNQLWTASEQTDPDARLSTLRLGHDRVG